jgi:hypothetical protein
MNTITIRREATCYTAEFAGPLAEEVAALFGGVVTVLTAYLPDADPREVKREIARRNPGFVVVIWSDAPGC